MVSICRMDEDGPLWGSVMNNGGEVPTRANCTSFPSEGDSNVNVRFKTNASNRILFYADHRRHLLLVD